MRILQSRVKVEGGSKELVSTHALKPAVFKYSQWELFLYFYRNTYKAVDISALDYAVFAFLLCILRKDLKYI